MTARENVGYFCDPCEFVTISLLDHIEQSRKEYQVVGIGVHSDEFFKATYNREPIKPYSERYRMANALKGVDFVFELTAEKLGYNEKELVSTYHTDQKKKKYHCAYAPGTYDLLHEGHLQHILEVRSLCDILIVGVNADKLVYSNKKKKTKMSQEERIKIVSSLKLVDYVYLVDNNNKKKANDWAKKNIGCSIDIICLGSDLVNQNPEDNPEKIPILFTERDPNIMKQRCSTYYREVIEKLQKEQINK